MAGKIRDGAGIDISNLAREHWEDLYLAYFFQLFGDLVVLINWELYLSNQKSDKTVKS